jgi:hypothetical protein
MRPITSSYETGKQEMTQKRDLDYYMANPGELPEGTDIEALVAGTSGVPAVEQVTEGTGEQSAASGAPGEEKTAAGEEKTQVEAQQGEPKPVIQSKNGKHSIPYSVLESERAQRQAAEAAQQQLLERITALEQQANAGTTAPAAGTAQTPELSDDEIDQISEDFPATGKAIKALMARVEVLTQQLGSVQQSEGNRRQAETQRASNTVQEAIDNNSTLSYWQTKDPEMFAEAVKLDNQLKANPRNKGLSFDERFQKVVTGMEAIYGPTELPEEYRTQLESAPAPAPAATAKPGTTVAATANKAIADAQASSRVRNLSEIPGGVPPEADEITQLGTMSAQDLGNKFMKMDMTQLSALLQRAA